MHMISLDMICPNARKTIFPQEGPGVIVFGTYTWYHLTSRQKYPEKKQLRILNRCYIICGLSDTQRSKASTNLTKINLHMICLEWYRLKSSEIKGRVDRLVDRLVGDTEQGRTFAVLRGHMQGRRTIYWYLINTSFKGEPSEQVLVTS